LATKYEIYKHLKYDKCIYYDKTKFQLALILSKFEVFSFV